MQAKNQLFLNLLSEAQLTQTQLAQILGITPTAISRWHKIGVPQYAAAYLQARAENIRLREQIQKLSKAL